MRTILFLINVKNRDGKLSGQHMVPIEVKDIMADLVEKALVTAKALALAKNTVRGLSQDAEIVQFQILP